MYKVDFRAHVGQDVRKANRLMEKPKRESKLYGFGVLRPESWFLVPFNNLNGANGQDARTRPIFHDFLFFFASSRWSCIKRGPRRHEIRIVHVDACLLHAFMLLLGLCFGMFGLARAWVGV